MGEIEGKVALVTGGGHGIGQAIALALSAAGAPVVVVGRNVDRLKKTSEAIAGRGGRAAAIACDVGNNVSVRGVFEAARASFGPVDILVNNAGMTASARLQDTPDDVWEAIIQTNVNGSFYCCKAALPDMVSKRWGRIITIASIAGLGGLAFSSAYSASKHAQIGLTRSLALEVARHNIAVNAICPGWVETEMLATAIDILVQKSGRTSGEARADLLKLSGQTRAITPEEVAAEVLRLACLDDAATTGQAITLL